MKYLYFLFFSFFFQSTIAQIPWSPYRPLKWSDFSGSIDSTAERGPSEAFSSTKVSYHHRNIRVNLKTHQYVMDFSVDCVFIQNHSWIKVRFENPDLLRHEQLHFDISQLYARKLLKKLQAAKFSANYKDEIQLIYKENWQESHAMQVKYDLETDHYNIKERQTEWENYIHNQLKNN